MRVCFGVGCTHHSKPRVGTAPHPCTGRFLSPPPSPPPHTSQSFPTALFLSPSSWLQDPPLSSLQLCVAAVVSSFWWKPGYQSLHPQLHTLSLRPGLAGRFTLGIQHCTWQHLPGPAQTIIKFLCLRTCWTQRLFSLAQKDNLLLKTNSFFYFRNYEAKTFLRPQSCPLCLQCWAIFKKSIPVVFS